MNTTYNRLQFVHHEEVFKTREDAYSYALDSCGYGRPALLAEPMVLLYENGEQPSEPNVILALGSAGDGQSVSKSRIFFIDTKKTEEELVALGDKLDAAIKSLKVEAVDSNTIDLTSKVTPEGTIISGDVKVADYEVYGYGTNNIIEATEYGIYAFVDLDYDQNTGELFLKVNGTTKSIQLPKDKHVVKGRYCPIYKDDKGNLKEAIVLTLADNTEVPIYVEQLINEWTTLEDGSTTPITLKRTRLDAKRVSGDYEWKDVLEGDVRLADQFSDNILVKTGDTKNPNRYLYVKGTADNIKYKDGISVKDAIENAETKISTSAGNVIYARPDGIYAAISVDYDAAKNVLKFKYSDGSSKEMKEVSYELNSVQLLDDITYDPLTESIVLRYINEKGEYHTVSIPASSIIEEWEVLNEGHNVRLVKSRQEGKGHDILTADVRISPKALNIVTEVNHELYVEGTARNIRYSIDPEVETTVEDALTSLANKDTELENAITEEINRAKAEEAAIKDMADANAQAILNLQATDAAINAKVDKNADDIKNLQATDAAINAKVDAVREAMMVGLTSNGNSLTITENSISGDGKSFNADVRLSTEFEAVKDNQNSKKNIIKLLSDGIHADVDLSYNPLDNTLYFTTSNERKAFALQSISVVDNIYYNEAEECIVIEYTVDHEQHETKVPVRGIIEEWTTEDTNTVKLSKERNSGATKDILRADVAICPLEKRIDNILKADEYGLYVSNNDIKAQIDEAAAEGAQKHKELSDKIDNEKAERLDSDTALKNLIDTVSGNVATEAQERTDADNAIRTAISGINESISDVNTSLSELSNSLNNEIANREAKDAEIEGKVAQNASGITALDNSIKAETYRATTAEQALSGKIATEHEEVFGAINAEAERAQGAEKALQASIDAEIKRATDVEASLTKLIDSETQRAQNIEGQLTTSINSEANERSTKDAQLDAAIKAETTRATSVENELRDKITAEASLARQGEANLATAINNEQTRAEAAETKLTTDLTAEITRAQNAEAGLSGAIASEVSQRETKDTELQNAIDALSGAQVSFADTTSVKLAKDASNVVRGTVKIANANSNVIKIDDTNEGLYATVGLEYNEGTNTLTFATTNSSKEIKLNAGSLIDSITYDSTNKKLVIAYTTTDGQKLSVDVAVADLYNEWDAVNKSEGSAIELSKVTDTVSGKSSLSARALLTNLDDNCVTITNNGLYVSRNGINETVKTSLSGDFKSLQDEIDRVEASGGLNADGTYNPSVTVSAKYIKDSTTLIGNDVILDGKLYDVSGKTDSNTQSITNIEGKLTDNQAEIDRIEAGAGLDADGNYVPNRSTNYIFSADTLTDADRILDATLKNTNTRIDNITGSLSGVTGDVTGLQAEIDRIESGAGLNEDGTYRTNVTACVINRAQSLMEADQYLDNAVCNLQRQVDRIVTGQSNTASASLYGDEGDDNKLKVNVRLSKGNAKGMEDAELTITSTGSTEFTDTNVLKLVAVTDMIPESEYNGLYLSNVWDCGEYEDGTVSEPDYSNKRA